MIILILLINKLTSWKANFLFFEMNKKQNQKFHAEFAVEMQVCS